MAADAEAVTIISQRQADIYAPLFVPPYSPPIGNGWHFLRSSFDPFSYTLSAGVNPPQNPGFTYAEIFSFGPAAFGELVINPQNSSVPTSFNTYGYSLFGDMIFHLASTISTATNIQSFQAYFSKIINGSVLNSQYTTQTVSFDATNKSNMTYRAATNSVFPPIIFDDFLGYPQLCFCSLYIYGGPPFVYGLAPVEIVNNSSTFLIDIFNGNLGTSQFIKAVGIDFFSKSNYVYLDQYVNGYPSFFKINFDKTFEPVVTVLNFDDPYLNNIIVSGSGDIFEIQPTPYGWLLTYNWGGKYSFPNQLTTSIIVSYDLRKWSLIIADPQDGAVFDAIHAVGGASCKIDRNGIYYFRPSNFSNDFYGGGLNIPWRSADYPFKPVSFSLPNENCGCNPILINTPS